MPLTSSRSGQTVSHPGLKRRRVLALGAGLLASPLRVLAQPAGKIWRIGFLGVRSRSTPSNPQPHYDAFVLGMRDLGYVEGKNLVIEWRFADGNYERLPALAVELVQTKPDLIFTHSTAATAALKRATSTIPIVASPVGDMVGSGFVASLGRPGGNITGTTAMDVELIPKHLELLKIITPGMSRVALLANPGNASHSRMLISAQAVAQRVGVKIIPVEGRNLEEVERAFATMRRERVDGLMVLSDAFFISLRPQIPALAIRYKLPSMFYYREDVIAGGLISYGQNVSDSYRRAATYVDKIFKGRKPADLPVEQPLKFDMLINRKTATLLGLKISQEMLLRATEVIE